MSEWFLGMQVSSTLIYVKIEFFLYRHVSFLHDNVVSLIWQMDGPCWLLFGGYCSQKYQYFLLGHAHMLMIGY